MNKVYLYKKISPYDNEAAHIYEHLFIDAFEQFVQQKGFSLGLFGYLGGRTYNDIMLIEGGFHNNKVEKLLYGFIKHPIKITEEAINKSLAVISSELTSHIKIIDKNKLITTLNEISKLPFHNIEEQNILEQFPAKEPKKSSLLILTKAQKDFKKLEIDFDYKGTSPEDIVVAYRIWHILIYNVLPIIRKLGGYDSDSSDPWFDEGKKWLSMYLKITLGKNSTTEKNLSDNIKKMQKEMDFSKLKKELNIYTNSFKNSETLSRIPEDIFINSGILVSRNKIAELFTSENVQRVWDKLELSIV